MLVRIQREGGRRTTADDLAERDRLAALPKAKKKLITQRPAAEGIGVTERQVRLLLRKLRRKSARAVIHELVGEHPIARRR